MQVEQKKMEFFRANKAEISKLIKSENVRRERRSLLPLSDEEIDLTVGEMMETVKSGGRIRQVKFPEPSRPPEPESSSPFPASPRERRADKTRQPVIPDNSFSFQATVCSNGFLLSSNGPRGLEQFILKTEEDLMEIFRETVLNVSQY